MALAAVAAGTSGVYNSADTNISVTLTAAISAGDVVVVVISSDNSVGGGGDPVSSVTDSQGNLYIARASYLRDPGTTSAGIVLNIYETIATSSLTTSDSVTVNFSTNTAAKAVALWKVTAASGFFAEFVTETGAVGNTANPTITTASAPASGNLVIGAVALETNETPTADSDTTNGSWSTAQTDVADSGGITTSCRLITQTKVVSASGNQTYDIVNTGRDHGIAILTYQETQNYNITLISKSAQKSTTAGTSATNTVISDSIAPTAGRMMIVIAAGFFNQTDTRFSISDNFGDSGGGVWKQITSYNVSSAYTGRVSIFRRYIGTGGSSGTITVTRTAGTVDQWLVADFYEADATTGTIGLKQASSRNNSSVTISPSLPNAPQTDNNVIITAVMNMSDTDMTQPSGYTTISESIGSSSSYSSAYKLNATSATVSWTDMGTFLNTAVSVELCGLTAESTNYVLAPHGHQNGDGVFGDAKPGPASTGGDVAFTTVIPNGPITHTLGIESGYAWSTYAVAATYDWSGTIKGVFDGWLPDDANLVAVDGFSAGGAAACEALRNSWVPPQGTLMGYVFEDPANVAGTITNPSGHDCILWASFNGTTWNANDINSGTIADVLDKYETALSITRQRMDTATIPGPTTHSPMTGGNGTTSPIAAPELLTSDFWALPITDSQSAFINGFISLTDSQSAYIEGTAPATSVVEHIDVRSGGAQTYTSTSFTPEANSLLVVVASTSQNGNDTDISWSISDSLGTLTWTKRAEVFDAAINNSWASGIVCYTAPIGASPSSMTVTLDPFVGTASGRQFEVSIFSVTGVDTASPLAQAVATAQTNFSGATSASVTPTLGVAPTSGSPVIAGFVVQNDGTATWTTPTGYTSLHSGTQTAAAMLTCYDLDTTTAAVQGSVSSSSNYDIHGFVIELASSSGVSNITDTQNVYVAGYNSITDSQTAYIDGAAIQITDSQNVFTHGHEIYDSSQSSSPLVLDAIQIESQGEALRSTGLAGDGGLPDDTQSSALTFGGWFRLDTDRNNYSALWIMQAGGYFGLVTDADGTTVRLQSSQGGSQINEALFSMSVGTWYYIGVAKSGSTATVYVCDENDTSFTLYSSLSCYDAMHLEDHLTLGDYGNFPGNNFIGSYAAVRFWQATLTESELWDEAHSNAAVRTTNLHRAYEFASIDLYDDASSYDGDLAEVGAGTAAQVTGPTVSSIGPAVNAYIYGHGVSIGSQAVYIEGVASATPITDSQLVYINGYISVLDNNPAYIHGSVAQTDTQLMYLHGFEPLTTTEDLYLHGHIAIADLQNAYIHGLDSITSSKNAYIPSSQSAEDNQLSYIAGIDSSVLSIDAFTAGHESSVDAQQAYIAGLGVVTASKLAFIPSGQSITDAQNIFVHGFDSLTDTVGGYIGGWESQTNSTDAFLHGHQSIVDTQMAFIRGLESSTLTQNAYTVGHDIFTGATDAYMAGWAAVTASKNAFIPSGNSVEENQPAFIRGLESLTDSQASYLRGLESTTGTQDVFIGGYESADSVINIHIAGHETNTSSLSAYLYGFDSLVGSQNAYIQGEGGFVFSHPAYIHGIDSQAVTTDAYTMGHVPMTASTSAFIYGLGADSSLQPGYVRGHVTIASDTDAYAHGHISIEDAVNLLISGHGAANDSRDVYLAGYDSATSTVSLFIDGIVIFTAIDQLGAFIRGLATQTSQLNLLVVGGSDSTSNLNAYVYGHGSIVDFVMAHVVSGQEITSSQLIYMYGSGWHGKLPHASVRIEIIKKEVSIDILA